MDREEILDRLRRIDEEASLMFDMTDRIHMIIVGGGALVLMEYLTRSTHDIDVLQVSHQIQDLMAQYDMNMQVQSYMNNFPYNFEDRAVPVKEIQGKLIDFYTAALEDIVIAKLYSIRDTDSLDITSPNVVNHIDWDLLRQLATSEDEAKANALNETRYNEFLDSYYDYERKYRP